MPRQARLTCPGLVHHVMARGIEGREIFKDDDDRELFLTRLVDVMQSPGSGQLYAWALMSNHFHLLIRPEQEVLSHTMSRLLTGHAVNFNIRHHRKGHLFQNRFKSIVVDEDAYFLELVRYIHLNPVRVGIVKDLAGLERYRYTGHAVILGRRRFPIQDVAGVLSRFAPNRKKSLTAYTSFVSDGFEQGHRDEFTGGGLIRSAGGMINLITRGFDGREQWDERILGCGDFVEAVLEEKDERRGTDVLNINDILNEVSTTTGITLAEILGKSKNRDISAARREFFTRAHEQASVSASTLAKLTGRSHVAVMKAINKARLTGD